MTPHPLPDLATGSLEAFERYYNREPLNDELRAIREGKSEEPRGPEVADGVTNEGTEAITGESTRQGTPGKTSASLRDWVPTRKQLGMLAETVGSEGWPVFLDLMKKRLEMLRETAITVSQNDPLRNKDDVAMEWAYHGLYRRAMSEMQAIVTEQLARLRVKE